MMAWPTEWNVKYPSLTSINIPILSNATYGITLRDLNNKKATFSVSAMWECIRPRNIEVSWFHVVWFSHQIPRHDILLWLVVKRKLKTQDLLRQWDVSFHLGFGSVLKVLRVSLICLQLLMLLLISLLPLAKMRSIRSVVCKLVFAASCYFIWQERNFWLFKKMKRSQDHILDMIKSNVRLKLLTCSFKQTSNVLMIANIWKLPMSRIQSPQH
ncbi:zinc knuckle CX2CX4HX4C containing protein [Tanacetum coccineum]